MKTGKQKQFFIVLAVFLILGISFKVMVLVEGLTEVRPVNAIPPVAGLLCGPVGALACGLGNLIADLAGTFSLNSVLGFIGNFMAAWLPYRLWYLLSEDAPNLHSGKNIFRYCFICLLGAMTVAWILSFGLYLLQGTWLRQIYTYVFFNNIGFSIGLGMPILIVLTSDSVGIQGCNAPERYRFLESGFGKRTVLPVYAGLMILLWVAVEVLERNPEGSPWMLAVSVPAAAGLFLLSV